METFELEIVTPNGVIYNGLAKEATLPGAEGEFGVLPGHASVVTLLDAGVVDFVRQDGIKESVVIDWGYVNVSNQRVCLIVQGAVAIVGANESEVARALSQAKDLLQGVADSSYAMASVVARMEQAAKNAIG
ncbi:MAG: ATP synthase F0F1 subunit epsilon [Sulfuricurvum sp. PC08-66]|nr:MAG: ATP synthase F0F1 subunit epsilon [Sulfuricurvum sp. PC08-66]